VLELVFPIVSAEPLPADHGYLLYAGLSRLVPELHTRNCIAVCPIPGRLIGQRRLALTRQSWLRLRLEAELIPRMIGLAGRELHVGPARLRLGAPTVQALKPADRLRSRLVVIKVKEAPTAAELTAELFARAARKQLDDLGISRNAQLAVGKRRTLRIKHKEIVGYEVLVERLAAEESLALQEHGLGGRRHMGCGVFVPVREREANT